jgi:hypothetical protein
MFVEVFSESGRLILLLMTSYNRSHNLRITVSRPTRTNQECKYLSQHLSEDRIITGKHKRIKVGLNICIHHVHHLPNRQPHQPHATKQARRRETPTLKQRYLQTPLITKHIPPSPIQPIIPSTHLARKLAKSQRPTPPNAKLKVGLPPKYQANKITKHN